MKHIIVLALLLLVGFTSYGQINQISIGLGRADQWGEPVYTFLGDTAIGLASQRSMDSRTMYVISMDQAVGKLHLYHMLAFNVMFHELHILTPSRIIQYQKSIRAIKTPAFDYSISASLLRPTRRITLYGGLNFRAQWAIRTSRISSGVVKDAYNSVTPVTLGINLNLRYQTRWLRIEFGYIGDVTSSSRDFIHHGQIVNMAPLKMQKIYLVLSGPIFRREKPPKKLKKKDFIKN